MKQLLEKDFVVAHGIHTQPVVDEVMTAAVDFDLVDMSSPIALQPQGKGSVSLHNEYDELSVIHYENFIDQCRKP